ncbi:hypothetical protein EDC04DRAFT_2901980 [Pisolithus marmoratus]|nr:hypothetical protein EDC04DRAFT_2901980 [Pisolithus marmoratus]
MSATKTQVPLGDGVKLPRAKSPHFTLTQSVPPSPRPSKAVSFASTSVLPDKERLPSPSPSESSLSSLESLELEKIPKLPGEVGRPGRGGYNLEEHLKWTDNEIRELKRVIHAAVKKYLDTTKSRSFQDLEAVRKVTDLAKRLLPATRRLSELLASSRLNPPSSQVPFIKASTKASKRVLGMRLCIDHLFCLRHVAAARLPLSGPPVPRNVGVKNVSVYGSIEYA